jgi:hypothetical protein
MPQPTSQLRVTRRIGLGLEILEPRQLLAGDGLQGFYYNDTGLTDLAEIHGDPNNPQGPPADPQIVFPNPFTGNPPDMGNAPPGTTLVDADDNWSMRWVGWVLVDQPGDWTFHTDSNDGVRLSVNGVQLIDHWNTHVVARDSGTINLAAGWYPIQLDYFQQNGTAAIRLLYEGPGQGQVVIPQNRLSSTDPNANLPIANAGPDRVVLLPADSVTLDGSATDNGTITSYQWSQLSGPSPATLSGESTDDLTARDLVEGTYEFQLTVTDNDENMASDTVIVNVFPLGGGGTVRGELKKWHKVTVDFTGPTTSETANPNPFMDFRLDVTFTHQGTGKTYVVPGYYAADGNAANSHATSGNVWRVHFAPDETGEWTYLASFRTGTDVAVSQQANPGSSAGWFDGAAGTLMIGATDKTGRDFRGQGRLDYVGAHYLQFQETGQYFLKQGADAPENLLAYRDFDGAFKSDGISDNRIKSYAAHVQDWQPGDPAWDSEEDADAVADDGKGLIGAINYLASEGMNAFSFLPMNIDGDDKNVFPYLTTNDRERLDVSRLAQWEILFEHADHLGMFLHFKTQETENELLLDNGNLGNQRILYYRELIARFSHHLALNWNLGEEINNASTAQKQSWASYFWNNDPYKHHIVIHNGANHYDLLGPPNGSSGSYLTGFSLQTNQADFAEVHDRVKDYLARSVAAGRPWAVAVDEPGDAQHALRPDNDAGNSHVDGRKNALWGTLMAGGWGDEYYFGYAHAHSDLTLEDFRSRDQWWDYPRYALQFFNENGIPFWEMVNDNAISSATDDYAFIKPGEVYTVYLKNGGTTNLDLSAATGSFSVHWFDPRNGGPLQTGSVTEVSGGAIRALGQPPSAINSDWALLVRRVQTEVSPDFDEDGDVDGSDLLAWQRGFGLLAPLGARATGDADGDQAVQGSDLAIWEAQFGSVPTVAAASSLDASPSFPTTGSAALPPHWQPHIIDRVLADQGESWDLLRWHGEPPSGRTDHPVRDGEILVSPPGDRNPQRPIDRVLSRGEFQLRRLDLDLALELSGDLPPN